MADNYIERHQEQYEARKAAWKQAQKYGKKKSPSTNQIKSDCNYFKAELLEKKGVRYRRS